MRLVKIVINVQNQAVPGAEGADHINVLFGATEKNIPLSEIADGKVSADLGEFEAGNYQVAVACVDAAGAALGTPFQFSATVVDLPPPAEAPIPVDAQIILV